MQILPPSQIETKINVLGDQSASIPAATFRTRATLRPRTSCACIKWALSLSRVRLNGEDHDRRPRPSLNRYSTSLRGSMNFSGPSFRSVDHVLVSIKMPLAYKSSCKSTVPFVFLPLPRRTQRSGFPYLAEENHGLSRQESVRGAVGSERTEGGIPACRPFPPLLN